MKKIFTLTLVLLAMAFAANAQYLLQEGFEGDGIPTGWTTIDNDGDGNNWYVLNNSQSSSGSFNVHSGEGHITSASYAGSALTPDNWLITPAVTLTSNSTLSFWAAGQDPAWASEHFSVYISTTGATVADFTTTLLSDQVVTGDMTQYMVNLASYTGQTVYIAFRHHNVTDMFRLNLDDVEIFAQTTDPLITVNPTSVNFGTALLGSSKNATVNVTAYNLTAAVTATTAAPFEVSADGTTYGTTATLASAGGTLYVRYTPTAVGTDNGTVTLSSTGATDVTITLTGSAIDCSNITIPFTEGFEGSIACWTMVSMDPANDEEFGVYEDPDAYEGDFDFSFSSYESASDYNQYLITPELTLNATESYLVKFYYQGYTATDSFKVLYSTTTNDLSSFALLADYPTVATSWTDVTLELPTGTKYVAINYCGEWRYYLYIDNFSILTTASSASLSNNALDFGVVEMGSTSDAQYVVLSTISIDEAITLTTTAPFEVSLDGTTFAATQTIPANSATVTSDSIFVRFVPTTAGTFNQNLILSSTTYNDTVALTGESVDCSIGITIPYTQDFNDAYVPPTCWTIGYDPEIFMSLGVDEEGTNYCIGMEGVDMLITPEIHGNSPIQVTFDYINYGGTGATAPTYFHVGYSTTDNNPASFIWQGENLCSTDAFESFSTVVPAGTKYVAVGASQIGTFLYWGIFEMEDVFIIDNLSLTAQTEALLTVSPESMSFGTIQYGATVPAQTAAVVGALLTSDINVTAPANFEVSADGTSYAATATLPQTGGNLFVRYNPSAPGSHNGTITVTSGSTSKTITVSGSAIDCSAAQTLPFFEGFESDLSGCWTILDADEDGYSWMNYGFDAFDGDGCISSASYINGVGVLYPDNWLITPQLSIPSEGAILSFYVNAQDASYPAEHYGVYVSTTGTAPSNFTLLYEEDLDANGGTRDQGAWKQKSVNLPYGGQTIYLALRHFNVSDMYWMNVDNFSVVKGTGVESHELATRIFPNPANNVLNINANSNINRVEVYNMMGQMVGMYNVNDMNTQINTTNFANGVYTVKIETENGTSTKKFTVAR